MILAVLIVLGGALGLATAATTSTDQTNSPYSKYPQLNVETAISDAQKAIEAKDFSLYSVMGYAEEVPGVDDKDLQKIKSEYGTKVIEGTSDTPMGEQGKAYNRNARLYADAYNRVILDIQGYLPTPLKPAVKCIYSLMKSSNAIQSVNLYDIDGFRYAIEFSFRNKQNNIVADDIELFSTPYDGQVWEGDKVPREISQQAMMEGSEIEDRLELTSKCHISQTFDNVLPQPLARKEWREIKRPTEFQ